MIADEFSAWWPRLVANAYRRTGSRAEAEDLASEAVERALKAERRGQEINHGYCFRAIQTQVLDEARRRVSFGPPASLDEIEPNLGPAARTDVAAAVADSSDAARLLGHMTAGQRRVVILTAAGYSQPEIAAGIGTTVDGVKQMITRARIQARQRR